jgi:Prokaryotic RING finger family 1
MELFALVVIVLVVYAGIRALATLGALATGTRYRAFRHLASRFGGRYESRGLSDPPTVSFPHGENSVRVGLAPMVPGQAAIPRTRVVVRFHRGIPFRLELAPAARPAPMQPPKGTRRVQLGDHEFDHGYVVQANDEEMARDFLTPAVRWSIDSLQRIVHPGGMLVSISPERLLVQIDRNLSNNREALLKAVSETLLIQDGLQAGVRKRLCEGVTIIAGAPDADAAPPSCKVCGEAIQFGPVVVCTVCDTPHHRECWEYTGVCSIYGCGSKTGKPGDVA